MDDLERNPLAGVITVWSDIGCPWASLALNTLHTGATDKGVELLIDHRAFPLELFNRRATPKTLIDAEIVAIAGLRAELGWRQWPSADSVYPVTSVPAMAAVQAAKHPDIGGLRGSDELDAALRRAFYVDGRCISIFSEIVEIAQDCPSIDRDALAASLARGGGIEDVHMQWQIAQRPSIDGSPHILCSRSDIVLHNPGVDYHWTASPDVGGVLRLVSYDPSWIDDVIATVAWPGRPITT